MRPKMILWDWNGCLLDDCEHVYMQGPVRIFAHFGLTCPPLETYRNEVESDFMTSFYWKYGIPAEVSAKDLDAIMKKGYDQQGEPPMQADAATTLEAMRRAGIRQALITGFDRAMVETSLLHHGVRGYFEEVHGNARKKTPIFQELLARAEIAPDQAIGVTDSLADVEMLQAAGVRAYICPRGFHGRARIDAARAAHPMMVVIDDLKSLITRL
jgi:phosphoglycolate phosphatase-like HAD superfamily hydrolase